MNTISVPVSIPGTAYEVLIGEGFLAEVGPSLKSLSGARKVALVTDDRVAGLFGMNVSTSLARAGFDVRDMAIPAGEASKNWGTAGQLVEEFAKAGLGRDDVVVALGGGVVGDLAGFCAAVYMRGIDFVQVPTTLLAMVDSSVGGKTAVDLSAGKNLAGAFKQPLAVFADIATLESLSAEEWQSGMGEVVKSAILDGEEFTAWIEANAAALEDRQADVVAEAVRLCVAFKARVVARDEREEGPRECLNYGHTLGHAIEKVAGYGTFTHGAAVAEGMRFAARVAMDLGLADAAFVKRQDRMLDYAGLDALDVQLAASQIMAAMHSDKKVRDGRVRMVLPSAPGEWSCVPVPDEVVAAHLDAWASTKRGERE